MILPASFEPTPRRFANMPPVTPPAEHEPAETPANEPAPPAEDSTKVADETAKTPETHAEKTASFTEPVDTKQAAAPSETPAEPAPFNAPPAAPVKEAAKENVVLSEPVHVEGAPSFSGAELSAAIAAAKNAEAGLLDGSLNDSREIDRAKGYSYSIISDLAQKATFVDGAAPDVVPLQTEAEDVFRTILATPHARQEVAQIAPMWINSANRRQGGVFFAGKLGSDEAKGTLNEYSIDLDNGKSLPVLMSPALAEQAKTTGPVAIVGWIVDDPAKSVPGYTGSAARPIYAAKIIPLQ
jgi:hypothetical protein